jgi:hypothetical protein
VDEMGVQYNMVESLTAIFLVNEIGLVLVTTVIATLLISGIVLTLVIRGSATRFMGALSIMIYVAAQILLVLYQFSLSYFVAIPYFVMPILQIIIVTVAKRHPNLDRSVIIALKNIIALSSSLTEDEPSYEDDISLQRGGEFVGNRMRFKVKVANNTKNVFTDLVVSVLSYPQDSLKLESEQSKTLSKLEPGGFRSPTFDFLPTLDCVKGNIIATVSYLDSAGEAHSLTTKPYTIRAVCDLLQPETIPPDSFEEKLTELTHGDMTVQVDDWSPSEMFSKAVQVLESSNFAEINSTEESEDGIFIAKVSGWAVGKYTGKNLALEITITGKSGVKGATCVVRVSGEDNAMIIPAIDEVSLKLAAWLCPLCGGKLSTTLIDALKSGRSVECPFCSVTVGR